MTLAEFRGIKGSPEEKAPEVALETREAHGTLGVAHVGAMEYVRVGLLLAVVTAVEVAVFYADLAQWALVAILIVLSATKFSLVVLWFMHLKFDSNLFSSLFVGGLLLAVGLFVVVLASLGGGLF